MSYSNYIEKAGYTTNSLRKEKLHLKNLGKKLIDSNNDYFPDPLHDSEYKRFRRQFKSDDKEVPKVFFDVIETILSTEEVSIYQFSYFPSNSSGKNYGNNPTHNVYKHSTVAKMREVDERLWGDVRRVSKLEAAGTREGALHLQGIVILESDKALPTVKGLTISPVHFEDAFELMPKLAYDSKPASQRVEREMGRLINPYELACYEVGLWATQTAKNKHQWGKKSKNPPTRWIVGLRT